MATCEPEMFPCGSRGDDFECKPPAYALSNNSDININRNIRIIRKPFRKHSDTGEVAGEARNRVVILNDFRCTGIKREITHSETTASIAVDAVVMRNEERNSGELFNFSSTHR